MDSYNVKQPSLVNNTKRVCPKSQKKGSHPPKHEQKNKTTLKCTKTDSLITGNRNTTPQKGNQEGTIQEKYGDFSCIPHSQKNRGVPHGAQFKKTEQAHHEHHIQNGNLGQHNSSSQTKRMGSLCRPYRCLSACPYSMLSSAPARLCHRKQILSVPRPSIRSEISPAHLHTHCTSGGSSPTRKRHKNIYVSRRLVTGSRIGKQAPSSHRHNNKTCHKSGLPDKLRKVSVDPNSVPRFFRSETRPPVSTCTTSFTQNTQGNRGGFLSNQKTKDFSPPLVTVSGTTSKPSRHSTGMQTENENYPNRAPKPISSSQGPSEQIDQTHKAHGANPTLVAQPPILTRRKTIHYPITNPYNVHRCIKPGLGCSTRHRADSGILERKRKETSHQCFGDDRNTVCPIQFQGQSSRTDGTSQVRQSYGSIVSKQRRRHKVKAPMQSDPRYTRVVQHHQHKIDRITHTRQGQLHCGFSITRELPPLRMATTPISSQTNLQQVRSTPDRPICINPKQTAAKLLHETQRPSSSNDGCFLHNMEEYPRVCLPSICDDRKSSTESSEGRGNPYADSTLVAQAPMVLNSGESTHSTSSDSPKQGRPPTTTGHNDLSPETVQPKINIMDHFRTSAVQAGFSDKAAGMSSKFLRPSTRGTYDSRLQYFFKWCSNIQIDPTSAPIGKIADFLIHLFDKKLAISTIRGYRSAISAIHKGNFPNGETVSSSKHLTRLMKSIFLSRPPQKKLSPSWSLTRVLRSLTKSPFEPMHISSLMNLTIKTTFLLAVATGRRRSFLHALTLSPGHIRWEVDGVRLIPNAKFVAKNQTMTSALNEVFIPSLKTHSSIEQDKLWCPVRALKWYVHKTENLRSSDQLFVSVHSPHGAVSPETISRWIVLAIKAGGDTTVLSSRVRAHDTRGTASSWALFQGIPLEDILKAAYWHNKNTFTSCYLSDVITNEAAFASAVLSCPNRK